MANFQYDCHRYGSLQHSRSGVTLEKIDYKLDTSGRVTITGRVGKNWKMSINDENSLDRRTVWVCNAIVVPKISSITYFLFPKMIWKESMRFFCRNLSDKKYYLWKIMMSKTSLVLYELSHVPQCFCMFTFKVMDGIIFVFIK